MFFHTCSVGVAALPAKRTDQLTWTSSCRTPGLEHWCCLRQRYGLQRCKILEAPPLNLHEQNDLIHHYLMTDFGGKLFGSS